MLQITHVLVSVYATLLFLNNFQLRNVYLTYHLVLEPLDLMTVPVRAAELGTP
jgi:hypothetical protein